jgi:hypothetical protein
LKREPLPASSQSQTRIDVGLFFSLMRRPLCCHQDYAGQDLIHVVQNGSENGSKRTAPVMPLKKLPCSPPSLKAWRAKPEAFK